MESRVAEVRFGRIHDRVARRLADACGHLMHTLWIEEQSSRHVSTGAIAKQLWSWYVLSFGFEYKGVE